MRLPQLRDLLAVVDAGSIRGAARILGIAQPVLTRSIRQLEEELHVQLLQRKARGVVPTVAGKAFAARARLIHNEVGRAREELAQLAGESAGTVAFGVLPRVGLFLVPAAVSLFQRENAGAKIRIVEGIPPILLPQLREGQLDFVIGTRARGRVDPDLTVHPLFRSQYVVAVRRGHPLRNARSLKELVDATWLFFMQGRQTSSILSRLFEENRLPLPKSIVNCEGYMTMLALIAGTDMLGVVARRLFESRLVRGFLEPLDLDESMPENTISLFLRADSPLSPAAAAMMAAVKAAAATYARTGE